MTQKHTPGPWYYKNSAGNHHGLIISEATGETIAVVYDNKNTQLMAAVLDLLEACQRTNKLLDDIIEGKYQDEIGISLIAKFARFSAIIREAIKKATE